MPEPHDDEQVGTDEGGSSDPYFGLAPESAEFLLEESKVALGEGMTPEDIVKTFKAGRAALSGDTKPPNLDADDDYADPGATALKKIEDMERRQKESEATRQREDVISGALAAAGIKTPEDRLAARGYMEQVSGRMNPTAAASDWAKRYLRKATAPAAPSGRPAARTTGNADEERRSVREESVDEMERRMFGNGSGSKLGSDLAAFKERQSR